jgi:hypothetical protein
MNYGKKFPVTSKGEEAVSKSSVEYKTGLHEKNLFTNNKIPSES